MKTSDKGIGLIKQYEGLKLHAYLCPAKVWTIGYGHTKGVKKGDVITESRAVDLLKDDLIDAESAVTKQDLAINQNQFDALVSFVYNVGSGAFAGSTLLKKIKKNPNDPLIRTEFAKWNKSKGRVLDGLVKRRKAESDLYFKQ